MKSRAESLRIKASSITFRVKIAGGAGDDGVGSSVLEGAGRGGPL